jgi:hypothetical protein
VETAFAAEIAFARGLRENILRYQKELTRRPGRGGGGMPARLLWIQ